MVNGTERTIEDLQEQVKLLAARTSTLESRPSPQFVMGVEHFDPGDWKSNKGVRRAFYRNISFADGSFHDIPLVFLSLLQAESRGWRNEYYLRATNVTKDGFQLEFWASQMDYGQFTFQWVAVDSRFTFGGANMPEPAAVLD